MKINILGTDYDIILDNENPKMKDSDGFCEWVAKKIIITDSCRNDEDVLENIDEYIHKVIRHEAFHALLRKWASKSGCKTKNLWICLRCNIRRFVQ